jgi:hypothetical protein
MFGFLLSFFYLAETDVVKKIKLNHFGWRHIDLDFTMEFLIADSFIPDSHSSTP